MFYDPQTKTLQSPTIHKVSGWWLTYPSEKYEFVSWDDDIYDIPKIWKNKIHVPNHQPGLYIIHLSPGSCCAAHSEGQDGQNP